MSVSNISSGRLNCLHACERGSGTSLSQLSGAHHSRGNVQVPREASMSARRLDPISEMCHDDDDVLQRACHIVTKPWRLCAAPTRHEFYVSRIYEPS